MIHNGQKIYPLKDKEKEAFEDEAEEEDDGKSCFTAKNVNMGFIIAFPIAFIIFVCYMIIQVKKAIKNYILMSFVPKLLMLVKITLLSNCSTKIYPFRDHHFENNN